ncbi:hypothetical protein QBA57_19410 [Streptomyces scabiei]|uniref:hypothetical protein n=1 Tax=Streptomyces scabiei TaxID=1930 RepID=UPI0004E7725C|nr:MULTISPECIES: hypothetical protein [Streptomyces]MBP5884888.1 hypothetical protein [Streptomyces sp. LBUM 1487]MBP5892323.1 hypothetical protein [Streptomyces sp. LBUM 1481]MBP5922558.1 hypothetical protein [Streptomyces sp. LBUM 1483]KFG10238.1 hypothetical protein IQ61_03870 [Streptomyces scabiei]MDX2569172.1 hypothetical protein [Streptomyces scabiei]
MDGEAAGEMRLLPWVGEGGKACYLVTDGECGDVSRAADVVEGVRLGMGRELLGHAGEMLTADTPDLELRFLVQRLSEALADAIRVAESRGQRLGQRRLG